MTRIRFDGSGEYANLSRCGGSPENAATIGLWSAGVHSSQSVTSRTRSDQGVATVRAVATVGAPLDVEHFAGMQAL